MSTPPARSPAGSRANHSAASGCPKPSTSTPRHRFRPLGAAPSPSPEPAPTSEACTHPVQVAGLCAVCGSELDPDGLNQTSIAMAHSSAGIKVSRSEAVRLDNEATQQLLTQRRLALIIDLDQTVIHATVDPTVGEWLGDRTNPNFPALEGVGRFKLASDGHTILRVEPYDTLVARAHQRRAQEDDMSDSDDEEWDDGPEGCWYYVKPRKGLKEFLERMATKYELHVYTMGTRSYADCVCQLVDPTGTLFGARILSRDENGSMLQKSLARLFPMDTSMVVVIDDRADVWKWSPNLVKVIPYEFFVGIGDINASFLPPAPGNGSNNEGADDEDSSEEEPEEAKSTEQPAEPTGSEESHDQQQQHDAPSSTFSSDSPTTPESSHAPAPGSTPESSSAPASTPGPSSDEQEKAVQAALAAQMDARPLAKMQQELEHPSSPRPSHAPSPSGSHETHATASLSQVEVNRSVPSSSTEAQEDAFNFGLGLVDTPSDLTHEHKQEHEPDADADQDDSDSDLGLRPRVLRDDDEELPRVADVLGSIHANWYAQWDAMQHLAETQDEVPPKPQVEEIIGRLKARVLAGCTLVFSGVFPLDTDPMVQPLVRSAQEFGAYVQLDVTKHVTHLVAARPGTEKIRIAQRRGVPHVVYPDWLHASVAHWTRLPEAAYALPLPPPSTEGRRSRMGTPAPEGPDQNEEEEEEGEARDPLAISHMDWGAAADEVDAFLEDDDDDDTGSESEDESRRSRSRSASVPSPRKRRLTPQADPAADEEALLSPLSKRRKLVEDRKGQSKLKHTVTTSEGFEGTADSQGSEGGEGAEGEEQVPSSDRDLDRGRTGVVAQRMVRRSSASSARPSRTQSEAGDSVDLDAFADDLELELDHNF